MNDLAPEMLVDSAVLKGGFTPFYLDGWLPIPVVLPNNPAQFFVPIFSDRREMKRMLKLWKIDEFDVKVVNDPVEFVISLAEAGSRVMYNPHIVDGITHWSEVKLP